MGGEMARKEGPDETRGCGSRARIRPFSCAFSPLEPPALLSYTCREQSNFLVRLDKYQRTSLTFEIIHNSIQWDVGKGVRRGLSDQAALWCTLVSPIRGRTSVTLEIKTITIKITAPLGPLDTNHH